MAIAFTHRQNNRKSRVGNAHLTQSISRFLTKFKKTYFGIIIILLCTLLLLNGCQSSSKITQNSIHLTLWHGINPPPNREGFQTLVDRFNQNNPNIEVEALYVGQADQQLPKLLTAIVGNTVPDLLWFSPMLTGQLVELGAIHPLETWLETNPHKADINPVMFETMELDGHLWSIPMATNNVGIFYRPSLFEAAGITEIPQTWDDLREVCRQLTRDENGDGEPDKYGMLLPLGKGEWTVFTWLPFLYSGGGDLVEKGEPNLVNDGAIAALELWQNLLKERIAMNSQPERGYENDPLLSGKVAMQLTGPWTLGYLQETGVDFDVFPIPEGKRRGTVLGGENLFLMKTGNTVTERAALEFLDYIMGEEFQIKWALDTGYLPINLKAQNSETYRQFVAENPVLQVFLEQMQWARSRPLVTGYPRISESLGRAIEATLLGKDPRKALQASQDRLEWILNLK
ncbi:ABC transporter substrate-binding protein [Oxynema aestuarii]|uniref:ABC transporter substrate-binding protein n=1 Tax=Oxynema aestuarii AP17 TaxID=2064643 RepID=A0A6H1U1S1_9CYAN|nr:ABC transporter substrate-binding protein [Oxynema aestuarii]QIZ71973.1 ABC transporter substrate-binding protein [Oxynema aestuarii AP17]